MRVRVIGAGRAGSALARALPASGVDFAGLWGRDRSANGAAAGVDVLVLAVPDGAISTVAGEVDPRPETTVIHLSGALGLEVLSPHERRGSVHPLMAIPDATTGAARLRAGGWFAVAGEQRAEDLVAALGGRPFRVVDGERVRYHAAACVASNHLVALLAQVDRLAAGAGVPVDAYLDLVRATVDHVGELGAAAALTGPVARGDWETVRGHLAVIDGNEIDLYEALAEAAASLAGRSDRWYDDDRG